MGNNESSEEDRQKMYRLRESIVNLTIQMMKRRHRTGVHQDSRAQREISPCMAIIRLRLGGVGVVRDSRRLVQIAGRILDVY